LLTWRATARDRDNLRFEVGPLADLIHDVAGRFERMLPPGEVELAVKAETLLAVRHDRDAITSVLLNLLTNAYKYTATPKKIALTVEDAEGFVVVRVTDNGIGIPAGEQKRIFEPFHRVGTGGSVRAGGAGLGLAIADVFVRAHHGTIEVESEEGKGSTFTVKLPGVIDGRRE